MKKYSGSGMGLLRWNQKSGNGFKPNPISNGIKLRCLNITVIDSVSDWIVKAVMMLVRSLL